MLLPHNGLLIVMMLRQPSSCADYPWTPCSMSSRTACPDLASSRPAGAVCLALTEPLCRVDFNTTSTKVRPDYISCRESAEFFGCQGKGDFPEVRKSHLLC